MGIKESVAEPGLTEIYRFLPLSLLEGFDPETLDNSDEFLGLIAKARVVQEFGKNIIARAVSGIFLEG